MKKFKKFVVALLLAFMLLALCGCESCKNDRDYVNINGKSIWIFDDVSIELPHGYFLSDYEKHRINDDTVELTLIFTNETEDEWN